MPGRLKNYLDDSILSLWAAMVLPCGANGSGGAYSILGCHAEVIRGDGEIWKESRDGRVS